MKCFAWIHLLLFVGVCFFWAQDVVAQDDDDDDPRSKYRPGLIATYADKSSEEFVRVDRQVILDGGDLVVDQRLGSLANEVVWRGYLMSQARGKYQISANIVGDVSISLNNKPIIRGRADTSSWIDSQPIELPFDWHPIEIRFRRTAKPARLALYWSGPRFQLEPINAGRFFHDPKDTPSDAFERGAVLSKALRCDSCHQNQSKVTPAPDLTKVAGNLNADWVVKWLAGDEQHATRRMPAFGFDEAEANALAAFLFSESAPAPRRRPIKGDAKKGERLFLTLGCLACHKHEKLGESGLFGGGDLTQIVSKRPAGFFEPWLRAPESINQHHRMPVYDLSDIERRNLAAFLGTVGEASKEPFPQKNDGLIARGQELFESNGCANCHTRSDRAYKKQNAPLLSSKSDWKKCCTKESDVKHKPSYKRPRNDQLALLTFYSETKGSPTQLSGKYLLMENNCLSCHSRDAEQGIGPNVLEIAKKHDSLTSQVPAMSPPSLTSVGDKLHDEAIVEALRRKIGTRRPWLHVRMPKFHLSDQEVTTLVTHFVQSDRIPGRAGKRPTTLGEPVLQVSGAQLVTTGGFGCTSCHQVGKSIPPKAPLNAKGPDLSMIGKRIRREWFDRFVPNPARIVPRMEMPSIKLAVRGMLDEKVDDQLAAVWHVLNQPDFNPPRPDAVRIVNRSGKAKSDEHAAVLTDVIRASETRYIKPFLIGLPNRHNVLFDFASGGLASWRIGDVAHQQTEGKSWYWETAGTKLMNGIAGETEINLKHADFDEQPQLAGQFVTEADGWRHLDGGGLELQYRLKFGKRDIVVGLAHAVSVTQTLSPIGGIGVKSLNGFRRRVKIENLPKDSTVRFRVVSDSFTVRRSQDRSILIVNDKPQTFVRAIKPDATKFDVYGMVSAKEFDGTTEFTLDYLCNLPVNGPLAKPIEFPPPEIAKLKVVPGYEATRLPLDGQLMPIGLSWKPDGTLITSTLKGNVWLATDTNDDGLEDRTQRFSDELAAPYGVAGHEKHVDVITKYALLRLHDADGDGRSERTETLVTGWGHTADYHDWVVGLPQDRRGNYYIALPCQQDKRSQAAAKYRGTVLRLGPRKPTALDPRRYHLELLTGGHRFPMGIALDRAENIFVTDNQGNYNPYNELNHVVRGARYGFINALERKPDFKPPLTPPAVNIPHPWTRSVNGVCFLDKGDFGPFDGHMIGCEYDTRRLIRMSLQKVGNTFQGAAYPFTYEAPKEGEPMLGPIVCAVSPGGDLYVGNIRDSGWGGANNIGSIVRLHPTDNIPAGIAEVTATKTGFNIAFTKPVDRKRAADVSNYSLQSVTRVSTPSYGGPDKDRRVEKIAAVKVASDGKSVAVTLDELREGFVYEFRLKDLVSDGEFFPAEAYYTLRKKL